MTVTLRMKLKPLGANADHNRTAKQGGDYQ